MGFDKNARPKIKKTVSVPEANNQLSRILDSPYFNKAPTQARFLKYVVEKGLEGKNIQEREIGYEILGDYNADSHTIRSTATIVRKKLDDYYREMGKKDQVRIEVLPGPSYPVQCTYQINVNDTRTLMMAEELLRTGSRASLEDALALLQDTELSEGAAEEQLFLFVRGWLVLTLTRAIFAVDDKINMRVSTATILEFYQTWVGGQKEATASNLLVKAAALFMFGNIDLASETFHEALTKDRDLVLTSPWYAVFLFFAKDDHKTALDLMRSKVNAEPDNYLARMLISFLLYCDRQYDEAMRAEPDVVFRVGGGGEPYRQLILGLILLASKEHDRSLFWLEDAEKRLQGLDRSHQAWPWSEFGVLAGKYSGLRAVALALSGEMEKAKGVLDNLRIHRHRDYLGLTLAYMAVGRMGRALVCLARGFARGDIIAPWIDKLPCFDHLMKHPRGKYIAETMREMTNKLDWKGYSAFNSDRSES